MSAPGIAAIVVTHESLATIDDCLERLRRAEGVAQVRVVDNDSRDGTLALVQRHAAADARLRFIGNPDNPGFSVGCNQGARDSDAPWLAFVNPDCMVEPDALARLLAHAQGQAQEVLLGADLVDEAGVRDGAARRRQPDFGRMLREAFAGRGRRPLDLPADDTQTLQPVDAVSGALMLISRALFERIGGFDEGYRLHAEDLDLCRRAREAGALVAVANDVRVVHVRGVSSRARPLFVEWHKHRGLWRYFRKFEGRQSGPAKRAAVAVAIGARLLASLAAKLAGR
ncbi:glycosyltransferase family 2 protein [Luteimonas aquatica]|uniref:glycosyltransferase family 2 protein n=1 Tax=Luteimonas aquatica TaxID=450364 RepID=UPI0030DC52AD